ncbi:hypothetical protein FMEXI_8211 [Fusarium mexicanum]|uniref:Uncharacterized protein n=1 Tax=Fusarium mexicanum TaxID=751941 RepID=A0A8H5MUK6_9HYPO|nr:hypothetical protein FMEXI_8211 [Fusarium mexicanum]
MVNEPLIAEFNQMTAGVAGTKGTAGTTSAALFPFLLFNINQTARAAETIPATAAGRPTPRPILFSDDMPPELPSEVSVGDGASSVDVLVDDASRAVDDVSRTVDTGLLSVKIVSDAVRIGRLKMITSTVGWASVHQTSEAEMS